MSPLKRGVSIETDYLNDSRILSVYFKGKERTDKYLLLSVHIVKYRCCPFSVTSCLSNPGYCLILFSWSGFVFMLKKVLMPSLTDKSFKLQESCTKRKLVSKTWAGQDLMLVQDIWSPERNHRLFGLPEKLHVSCVRLHTMLK